MPSFLRFPQLTRRKQILLYSTTVIEEQQKTQLLKADEIATMLGLKVQTVYTMARRGELEKVKLSRRCVRFRVGDVERFIQKRDSGELRIRF